MGRPFAIVVADDWGFRSSCRAALAGAGYRVAAPTAREGATYFLSSAYPPEVVVVSAREKRGEELRDAIARAVRPVAVVAVERGADERSCGPRPLLDAVQGALERLANEDLGRREDPSLVTLGVEELDTPHLALLTLLNALEAALRAGSHQDRTDRLEALRGSAEAHFACEESLMEAHGYAEREEHAREHGRLLEELRAISKRSAEEEPGAPAALILALRDWLEVHIRTMDRALADRLAAGAGGRSR